MQNKLGDVKFNVQVRTADNTLQFKAPVGEYKIHPGRLFDVKLLGEE